LFRFTNYQEKFMLEQSLLIKLSAPGISDDTTSLLRREYMAIKHLFQAQTTLAQQFLGVQAAALSEAVVKGSSQITFTLPDGVVWLLSSEGLTEVESIPSERRVQFIGGWFGRVTHTELHTALIKRLEDLERSPNRALMVSGSLLRYAIGVHMIYNMLPAGKTVIYAGVEDDDIPNQPVDINHGPAIKTGMGLGIEEGQTHDGRGELAVPYIEAARGFFLPQWVAFDEHGQLLLGSIGEAEAHIASMQHYLAIIQTAIAIAPYLVVDEACQQKRYGMLGQLVNQGRAFAQYQLQQIVRTIQHRVVEHKLDRGLRLSLPFFNDQTLTMEEYNFEVIPAGRIMFVSAFLVLAVQHQGAKVVQDIHFNQSTRKHLLSQLSKLQQAFLR
jgi:hypothetical protein